MFIYLAIRYEINKLKRLRSTQKTLQRIYYLQRKLASFEKENESMAPQLERGVQIYDKDRTRNNLYNPDNPKNLFLISESLEALMPINRTKWKYEDRWHRICLILQAPGVFFCAIFIPTVNPAIDKHGWTKLINCFHIISSPILTVTLCEALLIDNTTLKQVSIKPLCTLFVSIPLSIFVFFTSRTDKPPAYHKVNMIQLISFILFSDHRPAHSALLC